jgi:small subunit ribosomal protein S1
VIEFSKDNKKIILSHTKVYQDVQAGEKARQESKAKKEDRDTRRAVKKIKENVEKTTLGDLEALANLKSDMEQEAKEKLEKMSKQKKTSAKKESDEKETEKKETEKKEDKKKEDSDKKEADK